MGAHGSQDQTRAATVAADPEVTDLQVVVLLHLEGGPPLDDPIPVEFDIYGVYKDPATLEIAKQLRAGDQAIVSYTEISDDRRTIHTGTAIRRLGA